jgi:RNA polymerase sigma factor (sigma-70 family)
MGVSERKGTASVALAQEGGTRWSPARRTDSDELVVETVRRHAEKALRIARHCTKTSDDALEAYARALLKLVRYKHDLRADTVQFWLFEVVRREAALVRRQRGRLVAVDDEELALMMPETAESAEERVLGLEVASRAGEALTALKTDEARALTLQAAGLSYAEIATRLGWTATKTNRTLTQGRAGFRRRYAELESGEACRHWAGVLAAGRDATFAERARLRTHLRGCPGCRATARELHDTSAVLAIVLPIALASSEAADRHGIVARFGEVLGRSVDGIAGIVTERATSATVQLHALTEAATAAKLAAVAASAVALTGGGVAVREVTRDGSARPAQQTQAPVERTTAASTPAAPPDATPPVRAGAVAQSRQPAASTPAAASKPEFADDSSAAGGSSSSTASGETFAPPPPAPADFERAPRSSGEFAGPSGGGGEFGR